MPLFFNCLHSSEQLLEKHVGPVGAAAEPPGRMPLQIEADNVAHPKIGNVKSGDGSGVAPGHRLKLLNIANIQSRIAAKLLPGSVYDLVQHKLLAGNSHGCIIGMHDNTAIIAFPLGDIGKDPFQNFICFGYACYRIQIEPVC